MQILFEKAAHDKVMQYILQATGEISGIGQSTLNAERDTILVKNVWIWDQTCTGATTEAVDHNAVFDLVAELTDQGVPMEELNVWWHSHANMKAFFSATDIETMQNWVNDKYLVSIVGNKRDEWYSRIEIKNPIPCSLEDISVSVAPEDVKPDLVEAVRAEIAEKVKAYTYPAKKFTKDEEPNSFELKNRANAEACGCEICLKFLAGTIKTFVYTGHTFDRESGMWWNTYDEDYVTERELATT